MTAVRWQKLGLCRDTPVDLWMPGRGESTAPAKAVCATCPVRDECLEHALTKPEHFGVWGGKSERERRALRRTRKAAA